MYCQRLSLVYGESIKYKTIILIFVSDYSPEYLIHFMKHSFFCVRQKQSVKLIYWKDRMDVSACV